MANTTVSRPAASRGEAPRKKLTRTEPLTPKKKLAPGTEVAISTAAWLAEQERAQEREQQAAGGPRTESFAKTVQKTQEWLAELGADLGWEDRHQTYIALRAVLHALRDRLTVNEAVELGAQLPMLVRGFYYEGWRPVGKPVKERTREEFLGHVSDELPPRLEVDPAVVTEAVFRLLDRRVSDGEVEDVKGILPKAVRELWPEYSKG